MIQRSGQTRWSKRKVPKGLTNCQVVRWLPEEGLLPEKIVEEAILDAGGCGTGTEKPSHALSGGSLVTLRKGCSGIYVVKGSEMEGAGKSQACSYSDILRCPPKTVIDSSGIFHIMPAHWVRIFFSFPQLHLTRLCLSSL